MEKNKLKLIIYEICKLSNLQRFLDNIKNLFCYHNNGGGELIDIVYPIGSIYITTNNTSPKQIFNIGEWEQIKDTFLLCTGDTYTAGSVVDAEL